MNLEKVIEILRSMYENNSDEYMTRKDVAQILTIILHNLIDNKDITISMNNLDERLKNGH